MTITTFRSLAKHLLRKYVTEELEAFFLSPTPLGNIAFLYSIAFKLILLSLELTAFMVRSMSTLPTYFFPMYSHI